MFDVKAEEMLNGARPQRYNHHQRQNVRRHTTVAKSRPLRGNDTMTRPPFYPFRSERAKAEYEARCLERAKAWPVPSEAMLLDTPSGRTFVRSTGRVTDPPLALLPGARVGSLMWTDSIAALSARHRTYALDIIGDVGFSVNRCKISNPADYVDWLDEVSMVLVPEKPLSLMGLSLGGSIAAQYALRFPGGYGAWCFSPQAGPCSRSLLASSSVSRSFLCLFPAVAEAPSVEHAAGCSRTRCVATTPVGHAPSKPSISCKRRCVLLLCAARPGQHSSPTRSGRACACLAYSWSARMKRSTLPRQPSAA
jgi:hypothetical protein